MPRWRTRSQGPLNCCLVHKYKQQWVCSLLQLVAAGRQSSYSPRRTTNTEALSWGFALTGQFPRHVRVQPLSRSLVPEPILCVEVRPAICSFGSIPPHTPSQALFLPARPCYPSREPVCNTRDPHGQASAFDKTASFSSYCTWPWCFSLRAVSSRWCGSLHVPSKVTMTFHILLQSILIVSKHIV